MTRRAHFHLLFFAAFVVVSLLVTPSEAGLYNSSDSVIDLNVTNFISTIVSSRSAWTVEFYSSWCGHCINFAPIWKSLAADVLSWRPLMVVAAIDCAESDNFPVCRQYNVTRFPTIKFFRPNSTAGDQGIYGEAWRNLDGLRAQMINFLEPFLDNLSRTFKSESFDGLKRSVSSSIQTVVIVAEKNDSYLGRELILDLLDDSKTIEVIRILDSNDVLLRSLNVSVPSVTVYNSEFREIISFSSVGTSHDAIVRIIKNPQEFKQPEEESEDGAGNIPQENESSSSNSSSVAAVFMVDLENSISYLLQNEVGLQTSISGEKLSVLKQFVKILAENFPGRLPIVNFLSRLSEWLNTLLSLDSEQFVQKMRSLQSSDVFIPPRQEWISCRGSREGLRGYPCSLWLLFHTLTVQAYNSRVPGEQFDPLEVPKAIADYVKEYFSCSECAQHFETMAANMERQIRNPPDGVLWFWRAHNQVNERLRGDASEDPQHPKIQFPPPSLCLPCKSENGEFDEAKVLEFLVRWYSRPAMNVSGVALFSQWSNNESHHPVMRLLDSKLDVQETMTIREVRRPLRSSWGFNAFDMSLCLILYISSAAIILVVYFVVLVKRRLRKKNHQKLYSPFV